MQKNKIKILLVENSTNLRELTKEAILSTGQNYSIDEAGSGEECLQRLSEKSYDVVLLDYSLPQINGLDVIRKTKENGWDVSIIMITGVGDEQVASEAISLGVERYITKVGNYLPTLLPHIDKVVEMRTLRKNLEKAYDDLKTAQAQLVRQGRLAAVGELAAGLAHEIGNPLQIILGNADLLVMDNSKSEELIAIKDAARQAKKIIEGLLDFSRQREMNFVSEDVNIIIDKTLGLYGKQIELKKIKVVKNYGDVPKITVSPSHIEQAFLNLITNAQKSMPKGGTLTITTGVAAGLLSRDVVANVNSQKVDLHQPLQDQFIEISFKDTGIGISKGNLTKLFEPFFTTYKEGTGLGLSVSYGIVKQHGGEILAFSDGENKGAEFVIKLPTKFSGGGKG